jgi:hypothetical protein
VGFRNANRSDGLLSKKEYKEYEESKEFQEGEQELGRLKNLLLELLVLLNSLNSFCLTLRVLLAPDLLAIPWHRRKASRSLA